MGVQNRAMQQKSICLICLFFFKKKWGIKEGKADPLCKNLTTFSFLNVSTKNHCYLWHNATHL